MQLKKHPLIFLAIIGLCVFSGLFYAQNAQAVAPLVIAILQIVGTAIGTGFGGVLAGLATKALSLGILFLGGILLSLALGGAMLRIGIAFLDWGKTGILFQGISMTNPANNPIISIGWTLTRDLINMMFILGLAYIGLATALNLSNFDTKKTFKNLLLVALLVNFTPVICGLVVDSANIVMNLFLSEVDYHKAAKAYEDTKDMLRLPDEVGIMREIEFWSLKCLLIGGYGVITGIVLLIFGLLLIIRHFVIWMLVILSPLAFFCYIFPKSKKYFEQWKKYFISWAFIGLPAAFFLYLGSHLLTLVTAKQIVVADDASQFLTRLGPYILTLFFSIVGLTSIRKVNIAGTAMIMGFANKSLAKIPSLSKRGFNMARRGTSAMALGSAAMFSAGYKESKSRGEGGTAPVVAGIGKVVKSGFGLSGEARMRALQVGQEAKKKAGMWAERAGLVEPGYYEETQAKKLDTDAQVSRLSKLSKDRIEEVQERLLKKRFKTDNDLKYLVALSRVKTAKRMPVSDKDIETVQKYGFLDPGAAKELSKAAPHRAWEINQEKYKKQIDEYVAQGMARDQAEEQARRKITRDTIYDMTAKDFVKYFQPSALTPETIIHLDPNQIKKFGQEASVEDRRAIRDKLAQPDVQDALLNEGIRAEQAGDRDTARRVERLLGELFGPNFAV